MLLFELANLGAEFKRYFEIVPALTPELRDHVYRIRHEVYCEELKYESLRQDSREWDQYDAHSLHCLIRSVKTRDYVGCTRLVLARPNDPLPFERTCAKTIDRSIIDPQLLPRHTIAEISRLAVVARYRNRRGEKELAVPLAEHSFGTQERPRFPYLTVGLYLGTIALAREYGITTLFVLTEPRLAKHLARLGVVIRQIGGAVDHRGIRVPSMMTVATIIDGLNFIVRPLYEVIVAEIRAGIAAQRQAVTVG